MRACLVAVLVSLLSSAPSLVSAKCSKKGEVFVVAKTPLRRGPGLNYPVAGFLELGKCMRFTELSGDQNWVLVQAKDSFGWVPWARLSNASQARLSGLRKGEEAAPIGSGQKRGYITTREATILYEQPDAISDAKKQLGPGARLLALSVSKNEQWVEVRDERGETGWVAMRQVEDKNEVLKLMPRTEAGVDVPLDTEEPSGRGPPDNLEADVRAENIERASASRAEGLEVHGAVLAGAALPSHSLDSNGAEGFRRYDISAFGGSGKIEAGATGIGPMSARLSYGFSFLAGLEADPGAGTIGGKQHEARIVLGLPLWVGASSQLTPELGYMLMIYDFDTALPGAEVGQFFSTRSHVGTLGASLRHDFSASLGLDLEAAFLLGSTEEYPFDLGNAALALGAVGSLGLHFGLSDQIDLLVRWDVRYRTNSFDGQSVLDETITEASLSDFVNGLYAGMAFTL